MERLAKWWWVVLLAAVLLAVFSFGLVKGVLYVAVVVAVILLFELLVKALFSRTNSVARTRESVGSAGAPASVVDELAIKFLQRHCDRTEEAVAWAARIAPLTALNEGQVYWEIATLRFFWVRTAASLHMEDARALIERLHWYFLEGIRTGGNRSQDSMAQFEQVLFVRVAGYSKAFNDAVGNREAKIAAVSQETLGVLEIAPSAPDEIREYFDQLASRMDDVLASLIMNRMAHS